MKIGIDIQPLQTGTRNAGVGQYLRHVLHNYPQEEGTFDYTLFLNGADYFEPLDPFPSHFKRVLIPRKPRLGKLWWCWDTIYLPYALAKQQIDLFHYNSLSEPEPMAPPFPFGSHKVIATIHDLIPFMLPELYPKALNASWRNFNFASKLRRLRYANAIITVSECSKRDIMEVLGYPEQQIFVIYNGVAPEFFQEPAAEDIEGFKAKYHLPDTCILYLGGYYSPRKNLQRLLEAYAALLRQELPEQPTLVLAGLSNSEHIAGMRSMLVETELAETVLCLPHIPARELPLLYRSATLFVYPSLYEGFGLPVAEALACGTLVATSNRSSLPEIGGDACLYFDPYNTHSIAEALYKGLTNRPLRERLCAKGPKRSLSFSWKQSAEKILDVYQQIGKRVPHDERHV